MVYLNNKEVFDLVAEIGVLMLSGSGEIGRTQDTLKSIAQSFGIKEFEPYLLSNGIFLSGSMSGEKMDVRIRAVPVKCNNLYMVETLNNLSRRIAKEHLSPEEVKKEVDKITAKPPYTDFITALCCGIGCGAFCMFFKGTFVDAVSTFATGFFLWYLLIVMEKRCKFPNIVINLFGSIFVTLMACTAVFTGFADQVDKIVIGAVMPLVPGVPFANAIRNFFNDDYLSGVIRLSDAVLTALSVGIGVGITITTWHSLIGGVSLW